MNGAIRRGLRNPFRNRVRTGVAVLLLGLILGLLALMVQAAFMTRRQLGRLEARVRTLIEWREAGAFGTGGFGGDKPVGEEGFSVRTLDKVRQIPQARHIVRIEEYIYTPQIDPSRGNAYAMIIGLRPGAALRAIGEVDYENARLIAGRPLGPADGEAPVAVVGKLYAKERLGLDAPTDLALAGQQVVLNGASGQVGAVIYHGREWWGFELLASPRLFRRAWPRLLTGYAMDARARHASPSPGGLASPRRGSRSLDDPRSHGPAAVQPPEDAVARCLARLRGARVEGFAAVGGGDDCRLEGRGLVGAALVAEGRVAHLAAFPA